MEEMAAVEVGVRETAAAMAAAWAAMAAMASLYFGSTSKEL
jgi:hypothetical protein